MKTDSLFYKLFKQSPQLVLELAGLAQERNYQFSSEEIKQTAFRLDGVLTPPSGNAKLPLIFVEVQFQLEHTFYSRFFCEIFFYLHQNQPDYTWHAVVIYPSRNMEASGERHYSALLQSPQVHRIYLEDLVNKPNQNARMCLVQLIVEDSKQAPKSARLLIEAIEKGKLVVDNKNEILEMIETILVYKFPTVSREEIQKMLGYNDISLKQTRFYQDVYAEGLQEGELKGKLEGKLEGELQGESKLLERLIVKRFGPATEDTRTRLKTATVDQLESWAERMLDALTLADVFSDH